MVVYTQGTDNEENNVAFGYLKINVAAAQRALPIYNAQIMVYGSEEERQQELLAVLQTNFSGETEMISLPAPEVAESQQPLPPGSPLPFTSYYVRIVAANFITRDRVPVQIFPGILSDLVINLQTTSYIA